MPNIPHKGIVVLSILSVFLLTALLFYKTKTAFSALNQVVISEVQIAGVGTSDDFIELYNPSDSNYDLNGHRLVKRAESGTSDTSIKSWGSETIIPAHGYYLWANSGWTPSVTPDASTSATLAANNGVALRLGPEDTGTIIDSVAWGTATNAFVETSPYPINPDAGGSIERKPGASSPLAGNGEDTNNNANDFALRVASDPQNSSSPIEPEGNVPTETPSPTPTEEVTPTPTGNPISGLVVINEVAWAGTVASDADEWLELYNTSDSQVDLTGWTLVATDGAPNITLSGTIPAKGYFLLERSDDNTVKDITADMFYSGALGNSGESLQLKNSTAQVVDTANADGGAWPAGDSTTRKSMERINPVSADADGNWATNDGVTINGKDAADGAILGTPKAANSAQNVTPTPTPTGEPTATPTEEVAPSPTEEPTATPTNEPSPTDEPTATPTVSPTPSPTPTPHSRIVGKFVFPKRTVICVVNYKLIRIMHLRFWMPFVTCS